jgi:hypothetical protein
VQCRPMTGVLEIFSSKLFKTFIQTAHNHYHAELGRPT